MSVITIDGKSQSTGVSIDYLRLVARFPLRPLKSESEYDRAVAIIDRLVLKPELTRGEDDYLDALTLFIQNYDDAHEDEMPRVDPVEMLKALMENRGMTTTDLGKLLGSKGAASEILHRKRSISKSHMAKLAAHFRVDAGVFLQPA
jgi:HTH-type transcriptional regulator/antitoxin HigA